MMNRRKQFNFDAAGLGSLNCLTAGGAPDIFNLIKSITSWCEEWYGRKDAVYGVAESTTAALDLVLRSFQNQSQEFIAVTNLSHPTVRQTADWFAQKVFQTETKIIRLELSRLFTLPKSLFLKNFMKMAYTAFSGKQGVLILEHIDYRYGVRLPIKEIAKEFENSPELKKIRLIVDCAQSAGLWALPALGENVSFIGCFHKHIGGPAGTAFFSIDSNDINNLPPYVQSMIMCDDSHCLPTIDVGKLKLVQHSLQGLLLRDIKVRQEMIVSLCEELGRDINQHTLFYQIHSDYRCHIITFSCRTEKRALEIQRMILDEGFIIGRSSERLRVSLGASHENSAIQRLSRLLAEALRETEL